MSLISLFRGAVLPEINRTICPLLSEQEFSEITGWHARNAGAQEDSAKRKGSKHRGSKDWTFEKRHQATQASYVLWMLFHLPTGDEVQFVSQFTLVLRRMRSMQTDLERA